MNWPADTTTVTVDLAELKGLTRYQLSSPKRQPARFHIVREAGRFDCDGAVGNWGGGGACTFTADQGYATALESQGIGRPDLRQQVQLAMHDVRLALPAELERQAYQKPKAADLVAAGVFKIDVAYLKALDAVGYRAGSVEKLVAMRIFHIEADGIGALAAIGPEFRNLAPDTLVAMSIHRVTPAFVRQASAANPELTAERAIEMRILGRAAPPRGRS